ncbi:hypothetical protein [Winogradskyella sp.]|uniref:hypothetical protein n=1 Tax=Winogradskyella sp. TaxID=1883156 RepID=UPI0025CFC1D3|nr:hypothetical protein [Winogradskyella sp.]
MERYKIIDFVDFLLKRVFQPKPIPEILIFNAWMDVVKDVNFHFPNTTEDDIFDKIKTNQNELVVFLYRIGSQLHKENREDLKPQIHFLMKDLCSCEIYFNTIMYI